jgi:outer membrane protein
MAHIFKEYKKFNVLREDLKAKIEESDSRAKSMAETIKTLQTELKSYASGSPEYSQTERKLAKASSDFEAFRKLAQSEFLREESQIYKTIYLEVTDTVEMYANHYHYTLIMRFSRDGLQETDDPGNVIKGMNRQVVFFRPQDDITVAILEYLNKKYSSEGGARPAGSEKSASGKKSTNN